MDTVYLGLGANISDPVRQLALAVDALKRHPRITLENVSSLYKTTPVGTGPQPDYYNAALAVRTDLSPRELLDVCHSLERRAGRERHTIGDPRPLDIDVLLFGDRIIAEPDLTVPHPRMSGRAFVLVPLAEIAPQVRHPVLGSTVAALAAAVTTAGVWRIPRQTAWTVLSS